MSKAPKFETVLFLFSLTSFLFINVLLGIVLHFKTTFIKHYLENGLIYFGLQFWRWQLDPEVYVLFGGFLTL